MRRFGLLLLWWAACWVAGGLWNVDAGYSKSFSRKPERYYQQIFCQKEGGLQEYRLKSGQRIDCLTATHAIEIDRAEKYYEAIGQALDYARQTTEKAGIVLIMTDNQRDQVKLASLMGAIIYHQLDINVWTINNAGEIKRIR